jgi:hypothetical protein
MAIVETTSKGFKVIEVTTEQCEQWGGLGICDHCGKRFVPTGKYVAVLNEVLCHHNCYEEWNSRAINYPEDRMFEDRHLERMIHRLERIG